MLRVFDRLPAINFDALMELYSESNRDNALEFHPQEEPGRALALVERSFEDYLREDFFRHRGVRYALWEESGRYVSGLRLEPYQNGLLLEALETHPDFRRCGFAKRLIKAVQQQDGVDRIWSHVDCSNLASLAVHASCDFRKVLGYAVYLDGSINTHSVTLCWEAEGK